MITLFFITIFSCGLISASQQYNDEESKKLLDYVHESIANHKELSKDTIELYQKKGADINKFFNIPMHSFTFDTCCLHSAVSCIDIYNSGDQSAIDILIACKADINAKSSSGFTALQIALNTVNPKPHLVRTLLKHNANPNEIYINDKDQNPLKTTVKHYFNGLWHREPKKYQLIISSLLEYGADINAKDSYGNTILGYVLKRRWLKKHIIARNLLDNGANPFIINEHKDSLAIIAQSTAYKDYSDAIIFIAKRLMLSWIEKHKNEYEGFREFKEITHDKYLQHPNYTHIKKIPRLPESVLKEIFKDLNYPWRYEDQINSHNFDIEQYKQIQEVE